MSKEGNKATGGPLNPSNPMPSMAASPTRRRWKYPAISDSWFRIHNTIRAEMGKFRAMLVHVSHHTEINSWKIDALKV